ncbi:MAG: sulfur carrier protein ThiS [Gammaproteobacteria bacterium]|nr:sulfur carrier protein ThiS [Gammaproteobacteria bacterium]
MEIFVNGKNKYVQDSYSIQDLLVSMDIEGQRLAVEVNEQIITKSRHNDYFFNESDHVEIVHAIGGG